jgi:hypothetical protein
VDQAIARPVNREGLDKRRSLQIASGNLLDIHRIPEGSAPNFKNQSWAIGAEVAVPETGANGVLATIGGRFGGWGLFMQDGKPEFAYGGRKARACENVR